MKKKDTEQGQITTKTNSFYGELSLEDFKKQLLMLYKQNCALDDGRSYFELQDTLFGEMFDNMARIEILKSENKIHEGKYDDSEIEEEAKKQYALDLESSDDKEEDINEES